MATTVDLSSPILLLAMPQVLDPFFHRTVVLLLHHQDEGSFGFIINRPTGIRVSEILHGFDITWRGPERSIAYFGGPVQPEIRTVIFSPHSAPRSADLEGVGSLVLPGLAITQSVSDLAALAANPPEQFRLVLGYAGWGEGQLVREILRNDWLIAPIQDELVFAADPEPVWTAALESLGFDPEASFWPPPAGSGEETAN